MPDLNPVSASASGLEGIVAAETVLSMVDGHAGVLVIRGHRLEDVAGRSYEWLLGELWRGFVKRDLEEVCRDLGRARTDAFASLAPLFPAARGMSPMSALRLFAAAVPDGGDDVEMRLVATVAVGLGAAVRMAAGDQPSSPDPEAGHAADLLRMVSGRGGSGRETAALGTYLATAMDHGLNASTFTARVVASTRAGVPAAVTAALCALEGPLHGGAPGPVLDMLDSIGEPENAEGWLESALERGDRLMGFGHRVYRVRDPRSEVIRAVVRGFGQNAGRLRYAEAVEAAALAVLARRKPGRPLRTNLAFYTALLLKALGVPRDAFTGIFAAARVVGWIAHAHEQAAGGRIIRPESVYVGPAPAAR